LAKKSSAAKASTPKPPNEVPKTLEEAMGEFVDDPLGYVYFAFEWGKGSLVDDEGPDVWQARTLSRIGAQCLTLDHALQLAIASGHGVGKTALIAWLILWFMSTRPHPQVLVTANTRSQLQTKTWRELAKWQKLAINGAWFEWSATAFKYAKEPETWFASAIPWSANNSEAFAGTHEAHVLVIYDEASAIDDVIWEVTEGAMTTPGAMWIAFGNPTLNTGRFKECFPGGRFAHRWITDQIDSRTARKANQAQIAQWIEDYGDDSDFVRVRVKGVFPRASVDQFIGQDLIDKAHARFREGFRTDWAPIVVGVDVAWKGDDESVIRVRQGFVLLYAVAYRGLDPSQLGQRVIKVIEAYQPSAVFIDEVGIGAGTLSYIRLLGFQAAGVNAGHTAPDEQHYHNHGAEMWGHIKQWLMDGGAIDPDDLTLAAQLMGREYTYDHLGRVWLESKDDMRVRHLSSPDHADALGFTFAAPVTMAARTVNTRAPQTVPEWDVFTGQLIRSVERALW
jgi:hypothetical protein